MRRRLRIIPVALGFAALAGCATDPNGQDVAPPIPAVTVGSGTSTVSDLLGRIYADALERVGTKVTLRLDQADDLAALQNDVTLVPALTGSLLHTYNPDAVARTPDNVTAALARSLPERLSMSDPSDVSDWRSNLVVTDAFAQHRDIQTVADLTAKGCRTLTVGIAAGATPPDLADAYHCSGATVRTFPADRLAPALAAGKIQVAVLPPTADTSGLTVLTDDGYAVPADNPVPVFVKDSLSVAQVKKLNKVAGTLATDDLRDMVGKVESHQETPDAAVTDWLNRNDL